MKYADKVLKYSSKISMEEVIELIKTELMNDSKDVFDYCKNSMTAIEQIINIPRKNAGYMSGKKFIKYLLIQLLGKLCSYQVYEFFNRNDQIYIEAFVMDIGDFKHYYVYQKMANGFYEMQEVSKGIIDFLFQSKLFESKNVYHQIGQYDINDNNSRSA